MPCTAAVGYPLTMEACRLPMSNGNNRIAILGCGGFIGSHILERIIDTTEYVVDGIDVADRRIRHLCRHPRFTYHHLDISDVNEVEVLLPPGGMVISLAALCNPYLYTNTPIAVIESNFCKMYPIVAACSKKGCRLIHFSTSEVYGTTLLSHQKAPPADNDPAWILHEETTPLILGSVKAQRWCYAAAKQLLERTIVAYGFEHGLDYTIVRPFNFIGPGMDFIPGVDGDGVPRVFACFMDALLHRKPLQLVDGGLQRRCFTAIDDAVDAVMSILECKKECFQKIFNIGNPENEMTIWQLADAMISMFKKLNDTASGEDFRVEEVAAQLFYGEGYEDSDRRVPSVDKIVQCTGWHPKTGLEATLEQAMLGFIKDYC